MTNQKSPFLTPLVIAAALSVIAFSGIGVAAITGHLSITHSRLNPFSSFSNTAASGIIQAPVVPTEGHAAGHVAFVGELDGVRTVFTGDALFPGGRILLQDTWDCDLSAALRSVERIAALQPGRLLAGHLAPVLDDASSHLQAALDRIARLLVPDSLA